jgi:son of sevenless-like protein
VEADNVDERISVIHRSLEIMMVLNEYNNFNGVIAVTSAINSSSVHRLYQKIKDVSGQ